MDRIVAAGERTGLHRVTPKGLRLRRQSAVETEHPRNPVVTKDLRTARPAGRPFVFEGKLYRLAQDCVPTYGYQVRALQVTEISVRTYAEKLIETPLVRASSRGWNAAAMHHIDAHEIGKGKWIAAVDALGN